MVLLPPLIERSAERAFSSGGERFPDTEEATSSNLVTPTIRLLSQCCGHGSVGRAQPCQGWGRGFEPRCPLHANKGAGLTGPFVTATSPSGKAEACKAFTPSRIWASPPANSRPAVSKLATGLFLLLPLFFPLLHPSALCCCRVVVLKSQCLALLSQIARSVALMAPLRVRSLCAC